MPYFLDLPQSTENNSVIKSHSMSPARKSLCLCLPTQSVEKVSFRKHKNRFFKKKKILIFNHAFCFLFISLSSMNFYLYSFVTINFLFCIFSLEVIPKTKQNKKKHKTSKLLSVWFLFFLTFLSFPFFSSLLSFCLTQVRPITNRQLRPS